MAVLALFAAVVVVALIVLENGSSYTLHAEFQDASGLVTGDLVMIGPNKVGTVKSIGLTASGAADIEMSINSNIGQMHQGTNALIHEDSLSGIASKYVALEPARRARRRSRTGA